MAKILVVEDEIEQLALRSQLLEHAGYEVITAQNAAAALPQLAECQAVLTDLRIPKLEDGLQLIQAAAAACVRTIVLSGAESDTVLPVDAFLTKPCSSKKLLETVARFCASAQGT
jgi:CheY-like chemotaxis protein